MTPPPGSTMTTLDDRATVAGMPQSRAERLTEDDRAYGRFLAAELDRLRAQFEKAQEALLTERNQWIVAMRDKYGHRNLPSDLAAALDVDRSTVHAVIKTGANRRTTPDRGRVTS